jgi:aminocarboxymuconate-semialdehyde decarboxylase
MAIDTHAHVVPADFPKYAGRNADIAWPSCCPASCGHRHVMMGGKVFRTVPDCAWDTARRIEDMDRTGVERQALSPMPELLSYWFDGADGLSMSRYINETIGDMVARAPDRFCGLGMLPLQDVDAAIAELENLMRDGRFRGVEIGSNVNGLPLGDPRFAPFFTTAEKLGAAVFVHALHPSGDERLVGPPLLKALVSFPLETAFAIAGLITGGVLSRHPDLRIAFSHGGGAFAAILPRLQHGWSELDAVKRLSPDSPRDLARRLYYDTLVYDPATLAHLVSVFGAQSLMVGTDYPFEIQERDPVGALDAAGLAPETREAIRSRNARRFLAIGE